MLQSIFNYKRSAPGVRPQRSQVKQITANELYQNLQNGNSPLLVDVRSPGEYHSDGHITGSRLIPLPALLQRTHELPKDQPIVCVCRSGSRSQVACEQLSQLGFKDLTNLSGGMIGWHRNGLPSK
jgi:rhodanese-related sulfurtransferase